MTVHKYILHLTDRPLVAMPQGAKPLYVAVQGKDLCLWALVDPAKTKVKRAFRVVGTGHDAPAKGYVGTAIQDGGRYVWHVFDEGEQK